jgi:hypothetical protein
MKMLPALSHRVAIAGTVTDAITLRAIAGARVVIVDVPKALVQKWKLIGRPGAQPETLTRGDGLFYFLDLPEGKFTLEASLPAAGKRYGTVQLKTNVKRSAQESGSVEFVSLVLQPTTIKGRITAGTKTAVMMAEVQIKGSGESQYSAASGDYVLAGIEPGNRTLQVTAPGYRRITEKTLLATPGEVKTINFQLIREGR